MITITLREVEKKFDDLIAEKSTREDIANWAEVMRKSRDNDQLIFDPSNEKDRIWKGLLYLTGVDLPDLDRRYLHSKQDFVEAKKQIFQCELESEQ